MTYHATETDRPGRWAVCFQDRPVVVGVDERKARRLADTLNRGRDEMNESNDHEGEDE